MIDVQTVQNIINLAENGPYKELPNVSGYSSTRVRRLLNGLCSLPDCRHYLEIGVHVGSTFIPALYDNNVKATCIDNWSLMGKMRPVFEENLAIHLPKRRVNIIEADCFTVPLDKIWQPVDVYFFDGAHDYQSQFLALTYFAPVMADRFVVLVDDWNWSEPRDGTNNAVFELLYDIVAKWELPGDYNGSEAGWWNGLGMYILDK